MAEELTDVGERFLTLFTPNEPAIRAFVRRLVPSRQDAAEIMQGVALVLWRKFQELDDPSQFRPWAFGVARFEAFAWLRDEARNRMVLANEVLDAVASDSLEIEDRLSFQRDALEACLNRLSGDQRQLILAAYAPQVQIQEVAVRSGRTVAAFYQWLHRMRMQLLECTRRKLQAGGLT